MSPTDVMRAKIRLARSTFPIWFGLSFGLVILYVLSVGPAVRLSEQGRIRPETVTRIYRPLVVVRGTPFERLLQSYVRFWLPPPQKVDAPLPRPDRF